MDIWYDFLRSSMLARATPSKMVTTSLSISAMSFGLPLVKVHLKEKEEMPKNLMKKYDTARKIYFNAQSCKYF